MPARSHVLHEATYRQVLELKPNVAVLPWGATEAHNFHLPHGTDVIEAVALAERAVERANAQGARCVLLPVIPFGNNNAQMYQAATITMRTTTQYAVLRDVAESLVRQGIDRMVLLNFHGANEFKPLIRDVMFDLPIFIVQVHGYLISPAAKKLMTNQGDHADEFETSLLLHLTPEWVEMKHAGSGATTASKLPSVTSTPGVWSPRDWAALTKDTGSGDPSQASAEKGKAALELLVGALTPVLTELSKAKSGDFPFVVQTQFVGSSSPIKPGQI